SVEARLAEAGLPPPRVAVEVSNTAGQLSRLLAHSDLVSIMSEAMLAGPPGEGLSPLPFAEARFTRAIGVLMRKGHALPPLARRFLEILQEDAGAPPGKRGIG
ncbi:MAG TPA: LysR substrate-binding domain-containing protein, partial [Ramlibacter sp.]